MADIIIFAILVIIGLYVVAKVLGGILYALGFNPPVWMIELPFFGVPSRFLAGVFSSISFIIFVFLAAIVFEIPFLSNFLMAKEIQ